MPPVRLILLVGILLIHGLPAMAQIELGAKAGFAVSTFVGSDDPEFSSKTNFTGGLTFRYEMNRNVSLQPEILYAVKGASTQTEVDGVLTDLSFTVTYLEMPALVRYSISPRSSVSPVLAVGPTLAWNADSRVKYSAVGSDLEFSEADESIRAFDVGVAAEAGVDFKWDLRTLTAGVRYTYGISTLTESGQERHNGSLAITAGIGL